jgi:hypothetical protein
MWLYQHTQHVTVSAHTACDCIAVKLPWDKDNSPSWNEICEIFLHVAVHTDSHTHVWNVIVQKVTSVHKLSLSNILLQCFLWWSLTRSLHITSYEGARGGAVGGDTALTSRQVVGSITVGVIGIFHRRNPSGRTMVLGSTHSLTEMNTWGLRRPMRRADNLTTFICQLS